MLPPFPRSAGEGRQLDRYGRPAEYFVATAGAGGFPDRERRLVGLQIAVRVRHGHGGFAQHVIGEAIAFFLKRPGDLERFQIVRPKTNCLPMIRIACLMALRTMGSPERE